MVKFGHVIPEIQTYRYARHNTSLPHWGWSNYNQHNAHIALNKLK